MPVLTALEYNWSILWNPSGLLPFYISPPVFMGQLNPIRPVTPCFSDSFLILSTHVLLGVPYRVFL